MVAGLANVLAIGAGEAAAGTLGEGAWTVPVKHPLIFEEIAGADDFGGLPMALACADGSGAVGGDACTVSIMQPIAKTKLHR
jgi:hypothetical protein